MIRRYEPFSAADLSIDYRKSKHGPVVLYRDHMHVVAGKEAQLNNMNARIKDLSGPKALRNPLSTYGMLVRSLRLVAGTNLYKMARSLGMTPAELSRSEFEGGEKPTLELLQKVYEYFNFVAEVPIQLSTLKIAAERPAYPWQIPEGAQDA